MTVEPQTCNHLKEELDIIEAISVSTHTHLINEINNARFHTIISNHLVFHIAEHFIFSLLSIIAASVYAQTHDEKDISNVPESFSASVLGNKERFVKNVLDAVKEAKEIKLEDTNIN